MYNVRFFDCVVVAMTDLSVSRLNEADDRPVSGGTKVRPRHVAIIMDGNGRWAKSRGLPRSEGHRRGVETVKTVLTAADREQIGILTLFAFSSENWLRPKEEVRHLMGLLRGFLRRDLAEINERNARVCMIGDRSSAPDDIVREIENAERLTGSNTGLRVNFAFNYGGRDDIVRAARSLAQKVSEGRMSPSDITEESLGQMLDTGDLCEPDLLIRTGGEQRISNFLLWQCAYTEFYFTDRYWPDFSERDFLDAIESFGSRQRRFGGL